MIPKGNGRLPDPFPEYEPVAAAVPFPFHVNYLYFLWNLLCEAAPLVAGRPRAPLSLILVPSFFSIPSFILGSSSYTFIISGPQTGYFPTSSSGCVGFIWFGTSKFLPCSPVHHLLQPFLFHSLHVSLRYGEFPLCFFVSVLQKACRGLVDPIYKL